MPLRMTHSNRKYVLSFVTGSPENSNWISGIAFGKNLWNHAYNSARNYFYDYNAKHSRV